MVKLPVHERDTNMHPRDCEVCQPLLDNFNEIHKRYPCYIEYRVLLKLFGIQGSTEQVQRYPFSLTEAERKKLGLTPVWWEGRVVEYGDGVAVKTNDSPGCAASFCPILQQEWGCKRVKEFTFPVH